MVREKKPKILRDKEKNKIIRYIWVLFETEEEKEERKKKRSIMKDTFWTRRSLLWA